MFLAYSLAIFSILFFLAKYDEYQRKLEKYGEYFWDDPALASDPWVDIYFIVQLFTAIQYLQA